jgi:hypothetical protein
MSQLKVLKDDQDRAQKEIDCFNYCSNIGEQAFIQMDFAKSAAYFKNATRSLHELDRMKQAKISVDKAWLILKQLDGQQQVDRLLKGISAVSRSGL